VFLLYTLTFKEGNQSTDTDSLNKYLTEQASNLPSNKLSPGIETIDRYADPMCGANQYIYCVDGYIECDDIFGTAQNALKNITDYTGASYKTGNTLGGCGTYTRKINLNDYVTDYDISINMTRGVYFDLSQCSQKRYPGKPWRVGGDSILEFQGCYPSEKDADDAWDNITNIMDIKKTQVYKENDQVLIQELFVKKLTTQGLPQLLKILDADKGKLYKIINGKKYYMGTIKIVTDPLYTVTLGIPGSKIDIGGVDKQYLLKDSLYNRYANDYYSDLGAGSHPRPVCKKGTFTSCLSNPPYTIKNGEYIPTSDPLLSVTPGPNPLKDPDTGTPASGPFVSPLLGPSIDLSYSLLEYNYFNTPNKESPFIQCIADYGTKIGDNLCCGQKGTLQDTKRVCPSEVPTCQGYSKEDNTYGYCV